jgi:hypothetical protein
MVERNPTASAAHRVRFLNRGERIFFSGSGARRRLSVCWSLALRSGRKTTRRSRRRRSAQLEVRSWQEELISGFSFKRAVGPARRVHGCHHWRHRFGLDRQVVTDKAIPREYEAMLWKGWKKIGTKQRSGPASRASRLPGGIDEFGGSRPIRSLRLCVFLMP